MGPVPAPEIAPEEFPEPVNGVIILSRDQAVRLARTMVSLINYLKINWARCHDDTPIQTLDAGPQEATVAI